MKTEKYLTPGVKIRQKEPQARTPLMGFLREAERISANFHFGWVVITKPHVDEAESHKHDYDQLLCFIGNDPDDMLNLHGEIELTLSEDGVNMEKHSITTAMSVFIPKGTYHCPLVFKKVEKPILNINIFFAEDYKRV